MRIGVVSDTHGDLRAINRVLAAAGKVDGWIHLGDNIRDAAAFENSGVPVFSVAGNCDFSGETEKTLGLWGVRVFMTHGHLYGAACSLAGIARRAEELGCRAALFGHTHVPLLNEDTDLLILNPGSPSRPRRGSHRSYALLYIEDGEIDADLMRI